MEGIKVTGHDFPQIVRTPCRVELKRRRAGNTVSSSANPWFELQEALFEVPTKLDTFRIIKGGRPYNGSCVSVSVLGIEGIRLTGTLRRRRGIVILAPRGYVAL